MLGDVEETVYVVDEEAEDEDIKTVSKKSEMLFVRGESRCPAPELERLLTGAAGDSVVLISPLTQS